MTFFRTKDLALAITAVFSLPSFGCSEKPAPKTLASLPTIKVDVLKASPQSQQGRAEVVGTVRARLRATLEAKVSGRISMLPVKLGQNVKRGAVIARLDAGEIRAKLSQSNALFAQAQTELKRFDALLSQGAVTQQEVDGVRARHQVARARVQEATSMLAYATVKAPFAGVVTQKYVHVGDVASPGKALVDLEAPGDYRLEVGVPEALIGHLKVGTPLPLRITETKNAIEGVVAEISPTADPNSRSYLVKIELPKVPAKESFRAGQFGRAFVPTGRTNMLRLPASAVQRRGQLELVFVLRKGTAQLRLIKTGKRFGDAVEIVSGIDADETLIVKSASALRDGQPVEVTR